MRPSSLGFHSKSDADLDYEKELEKRTKSYTSDVSEVMAKLKGGSLKDLDKRIISHKLID